MTGNPAAAAQQARLMLSRSLPGANKTVKDHMARAALIAEAIYINLEPIGPFKWRAKHLRWFLEHYTKQLSSPRRYDFFRTIRSIACVRGKWEDWEPFLRGSWEWPRGVGRHGKMTP